MAILNFTGFETGSGHELLEILGTPNIASLDDNKDVHSGRYSMYVSSDHGDGYGGFTLGELEDGYQVAMNRNRIYTRFYCYFKKLPAVSTEFYSVKDQNDYIKMSLRVNAAGDLIVKGYSTTTSDAGETFTTYETTFEESLWYRIEVSSVSNGLTEIKINGISLGSISMLSDNVYIKNIMLGNADDGYDGHDEDYEFSIDDVEIRNDAFPGNGNVALVEPLAFGYYSEWNGQVEDITESLDDFYLKALDGRRVTFIFYIKDEFYLGTITAIKPIAFCTTTGGNTCRIKNFIRKNGTDVYQNKFVTVPALSYYPVSNIYELDVNTNTAWTRAGIKDLQYGILTSDDTTLAHCDYIALQINYY